MLSFLTPPTFSALHQLDRTVTHVADSGTLCTLSSSGEAGPEGSPFGSHVDYVLDEQVTNATSYMTLDPGCSDFFRP